MKELMPQQQQWQERVVDLAIEDSSHAADA
jgi:hypothetical protein